MKAVLVRADTFAGAAGALGSSYTQQSDASANTVNRDGAGNATVTVATVELAAADAGNVYQADQYSKIRPSAITSGQYLYACTRMSGVYPNGNRYSLYSDGPVFDTYLQKTVNNVTTSLGGGLCALAVNDWFELQSYGSQHQVLLNGVVQALFVDASLPAGRTGLALYTSPAGGAIGDWEGGHLYADSWGAAPLTASRRRG